MCMQKSQKILNPIIDWEEEDVWDFIKTYNIPYCKLYDEGFTRLGCIGCPMATVKMRNAEFERYPKYKTAYMKAFERMLKNTKPTETYSVSSGYKKKNRKSNFGGTPESVMKWWLK